MKKKIVIECSVLSKDNRTTYKATLVEPYLDSDYVFHNESFYNLLNDLLVFYGFTTEPEIQDYWEEYCLSDVVLRTEEFFSELLSTKDMILEII